MRRTRDNGQQGGPSPFSLTTLFVALALGACDDALDQRLAIVDVPRVLAVIAEPAEARPGAMVTYRAVIAGPDGPIAVDLPGARATLDDAMVFEGPGSTRSRTPIADELGWAYCTTPKAPTEDNVVSASCVAGDALVPLVVGPDAISATGTLPNDGCLRFGPDVPPGGFRPRDADPTGGFYQPVRLDTHGLAPLAFGMSRITCNLANATPEAFRQYALEYRANENPVLEPPLLDGVAISTTGTVASDRDVTLTAVWTAASVESYLYFDRERQVLVDRRESLRVSWFATGGAFPVDASAIDEPAVDGAATTSASMTWRTPAGPSGATVHVWIVLRDARNGIAVAHLPLQLE